MDLITTPAVTGQSPPENSIVHSTFASLTSRSPSNPVHLVQYDDTLPIVAVALTANGQPYAVPSGAAVNVRLAKQDGTYVYNPAYGISGDGYTVYIAITVQMTVFSGKVSPIVEVVLNGAVAGTGFFVLDIDPNPIPEDAIESTDEYKTIQQLAAQVQQAAQIVSDNEEAINAVADNLTALNTVAGIAGNVTTVAGISGNVTTVSGNVAQMQQVVDNLTDIQNAEENAAAAAASATLSESWAVGGTGTRSGEDTNNSQFWAGKAAESAGGYLGYFDTQEDLQAAHPTGQGGQWAFVGSTDTIWTWDADTSAWVNTTPQASASVLGMVKVSDSPSASNTAAGGWAASPAALQAVSKDIYMVRTYAQYDTATAGRLASVVIQLPSGVSGGINQFAVSIEVEDEANCQLWHFVSIGSGSATVYFKNPDGSNFIQGSAIWFNAIVVVNR